MTERESAEGGTGILRSLRNLAATLLATLQTRLELLVTEIEEERARLLQLLLWAAAALFLLGMGVLLLVVLVIVLFWDTHRVAAVAVLAGLFLAGGMGAAIGARNRMRARTRLLSGTLGELAKDRSELTSR